MGENREGRAQTQAGAERHAEEQQTMLAYALDRAQECAFLIDVEDNARFLYVNAAVSRSLGYSRAELLSMSVPDIDPDYALERVQQAFRGRLAPATFEARHMTKDGRIFPVEIKSARFEYGGKPCCLCLVSDITERKQAEEERRKTEGQRAMLEFAMDRVQEAAFLLEIGTGARFVYVNAAASRSLGYSREELLQMAVPDIDPGHTLERLRQRFAGQQTPIVIETRHKRKDGSTFPAEVEINYFEFGGKLYGMSLARDITARKEAEERMEMLMREVNHRAKNLLSVVQAIVRLTKGRGDPELFEKLLNERIAALSANHDLLIQNEWRGVYMRELATAQLAHLKGLVGSRIVIEGPPIMLKPAAAQAVGMALHELSTNAGKYGSLSCAGGSILLEWRVQSGDGEGRLVMQWSERGGPQPTPPARLGFGHRVTVRMVEDALDAKVSLAYRSPGLIWQLIAPLAVAVEPAHRMLP